MMLDEVISNIVYNKDIQKLLKQSQLDLTHSYGEITQFQIDECKENNTSIGKEGFQIGEPFDGDIENAPILFLSSNPAFNFDEVSPRYFADSGKIFMPEHVDMKNRVNISGNKYSLEEIKKMFTVPQKEFQFEEIKEFFKTRIQNSPARDDKDQTLRIPLKDGGTIGVSYWTCVRNNTELLLPSTLTSQWTKLTPSQRVREIMKYAVCMEIVPFRSSSEIGLNSQLLNVCWSNFTQNLLSLSVAEVIVLVGNNVLNTFIAQMSLTPSDTKALKSRSIVQVNIGCKVRQVVKVDFNSGKFSNFNNFFSVNVMNQLKLSVANSSLISPNNDGVNGGTCSKQDSNDESDDDMLSRLSLKFSPEDFVTHD